MPKSSKSASSKKPDNVMPKPPLSRRERVVAVAKKPFVAGHKRAKNFLSRRPHRSFRLTRARDYRRSLNLPGYLAFSLEVWRTIWRNRNTFIWMVVIYAIITAILVGMASQDTYNEVTKALRDTGEDILGGSVDELGKASLLFIAAASGSFSETLSADQQVYAGVIVLLTWLTTVWLLRNMLAGRVVKLRDGLYNASAPILSTFVVLIVMTVQLLPIAIAILGFNAAAATGLLDGGVEAMLFWIAAGLLAIMSLFWATSTFIALIVVTLPGMYPFKALSIAGDLVTGRRVRILLRLLWLGLVSIVVWAAVMLPIILFDVWLKGTFPQIEWLPLVPIMLLILTSVTVVWVASYIYLLYRKVVDDDALPA